MASEISAYEEVLLDKFRDWVDLEMRKRIDLLLLELVLVMTLYPVTSLAQPLPSLPSEGSSDQFSLDSLRREVNKRILTNADKQEIRSCDREKTKFLKQCRVSDPGTVDLDRKLNEAKLAGANPNDPAIQSLMERKFALEQKCDDGFATTALGGKCRSGDKKRQAALEKALAGDKAYQSLLQRTRSSETERL